MFLQNFHFNVLEKISSLTNTKFFSFSIFLIFELYEKHLLKQDNDVGYFQCPRVLQKYVGKIMIEMEGKKT